MEDTPEPTRIRERIRQVAFLVYYLLAVLVCVMVARSLGVMRFTELWPALAFPTTFAVLGVGFRSYLRSENGEAVLERIVLAVMRTSWFRAFQSAKNRNAFFSAVTVHLARRQLAASFTLLAAGLATLLFSISIADRVIALLLLTSALIGVADVSLRFRRLAVALYGTNALELAEICEFVVATSSSAGDGDGRFERLYPEWAISQAMGDALAELDTAGIAVGGR